MVLDCRPFVDMVLGSYGFCRPFGAPGRVVVVVLILLVERRKEEGKEGKSERMASLYRKISQCM